MEKKSEILSGYPIEAYLQCADGTDWNDDTRICYRRILYELQRYLAGHTPDTETLRRWQQDLRKTGYRTQSINIRISAANNYFRWCGRYDLVMHHHPADSTPPPELTRAEYLQLLRTARKRDWHMVYLLVKLFAITGVPVQYLEQITPQVVRNGGAALYSRSGRFDLKMPDVLRRELLEYIEKHGLSVGPVFATRSGKPICRSGINRKLQELCQEAGVPKEKGNPRCLRNLCQTTKDTLYANMEQQLQQMYNLLLQAEQESAGWSAGA